MTSSRVAAIDIGTNSIHMIVAERRGRGYRVVDREKEMVQLGLGSLDGEPLTAAGMDRALTALTRMREIAADWNADEIMAVATSAVREAPNQRRFLRAVREGAGIEVQVISGETEAALIFAAVRSAVDLQDRIALCVDIGGGSVELIVGSTKGIRYAVSEPLGSLRLSQRFSLEERAEAQDVTACRRHVREQLRGLHKRLHAAGFDLCIGTSGTILALARIAGKTDPGPQAHGLRKLRRQKVADLADELASLTNDERVARFPFDRKRGVTIVAGAIVLDEIMRAAGADSLLACSAAMREGLVETRFAGKRTRRAAARSVRRSSVVDMARRTGCDLVHGRQVARLALRIFDQTREIHELSDEWRDLLGAAAMLHESGMHVSDREHDRHTEYLIRHGDLKGFTEEQLAVIAIAARFYRKVPGEWSGVEATHRDAARKLTAILRVAEALDRGHRRRVSDVIISHRDGRVIFDVRARGDAAVEITSATERARFFAKTFDVKTKFVVT